jgi:uncharacterized protein (TIGR02145 family)/uncharacterized repeat protein (TIGR02543 family)
LPTPTRSGYIFVGWYTTSTGETEVTTNTEFSANATIYARWNRIYNVFTDSRDGKTYKKIAIGSQIWMAENLNYDVPDNASGSKCYGNSADSCAKYGRLYNWSTAMNGASSSSHRYSGVQGVCPVGWHLPSDAEWVALEYEVGDPAGTKLKSSTGWNSYSGVPAGTDQYGWSALPGGNGSGSFASFGNAGNNGYWWSATENNANNAWYRYMYYSSEYVGRYSNDETLLFSVRCVEDY